MVLPLTHTAPANNLYTHFKLPDLPAQWAAFADGRLDEHEFLDVIARTVRG